MSQTARITLATILGMLGGGTYAIGVQCRLFGAETAFDSGGVWFMGVSGMMIGGLGAWFSRGIKGSLTERLTFAVLSIVGAVVFFLASRSALEGRGWLVQLLICAGSAAIGIFFGLILCRYDPSVKFGKSLVDESRWRDSSQ
jgi:hypothetical protein